MNPAAIISILIVFFLLVLFFTDGNDNGTNGAV